MQYDHSVTGNFAILYLVLLDPTLFENTTMIDWLWNIFDQYFTTDDGLPGRLLLLIVTAILIWRSIYLLAQLQPTLPEIGAPSLSQAARTWFPTRADRVRTAIEQVKSETDLLLSQIANVEASKGLMQARANLQAAMGELDHSPLPPSQAVQGLTLQEITNCMALVQIGDAERARLQSLLIMALEERQS